MADSQRLIANRLLFAAAMFVIFPSVHNPPTTPSLLTTVATDDLLRTTKYLLLYLLLTTYHVLLPTTDYVRLATYNLLHTTHTAYYLRPTIYYLLLTTC